MYLMPAVSGFITRKYMNEKHEPYQFCVMSVLCLYLNVGVNMYFSSD